MDPFRALEPPEANDNVATALSLGEARPMGREIKDTRAGGGHEQRRAQSTTKHASR